MARCMLSVRVCLLTHAVSRMKNSQYCHAPFGGVDFAYNDVGIAPHDPLPGARSASRRHRESGERLPQLAGCSRQPATRRPGSFARDILESPAAALVPERYIAVLPVESPPHLIHFGVACDLAFANFAFRQIDFANLLIWQVMATSVLLCKAHKELRGDFLVMLGQVPDGSDRFFKQLYHPGTVSHKSIK